ncbi:hypothetical protein Q5752_000226 [Cryptotrichosporon argae]
MVRRHKDGPQRDELTTGRDADQGEVLQWVYVEPGQQFVRLSYARGQTPRYGTAAVAPPLSNLARMVTHPAASMRDVTRPTTISAPLAETPLQVYLDELDRVAATLSGQLNSLNRLRKRHGSTAAWSKRASRFQADVTEVTRFLRAEIGAHSQANQEGAQTRELPLNSVDCEDAADFHFKYRNAARETWTEQFTRDYFRVKSLLAKAYYTWWASRYGERSIPLDDKQLKEHLDSLAANIPRPSAKHGHGTAKPGKKGKKKKKRSHSASQTTPSSVAHASSSRHTGTLHLSEYVPRGERDGPWFQILGGKTVPQPTYRSRDDTVATRARLVEGVTNVDGDFWIIDNRDDALGEHFRPKRTYNRFAETDAFAELWLERPPALGRSRSAHTGMRRVLAEWARPDDLSVGKTSPRAQDGSDDSESTAATPTSALADANAFCVPAFASGVHGQVQTSVCAGPTEPTALDVLSNNPYPVKPGGFLVGIYLALGLYGIHLSQLRHYFRTYRTDPRRTKLLVLWIGFLSSAQILIIVASGYHYFVRSIRNATVIWGEFWWPLSVQDGLIPLMAFTGQLYFGHRAWLVTGRKRWFGLLVASLAFITLVAGVALAVTARIWANDPWVSVLSFDSRKIGLPSQVVAIVWMGLSAAIDALLSAVLVAQFVRAGWTVLTYRLVALTLETVLLTHAVGGVMCVLFLTSPARARTGRDAFWALLEIVTELYALSMLFTINARRKTRIAVHGPAAVTDYEMEAAEAAAVRARARANPQAGKARAGAAPGADARRSSDGTGDTDGTDGPSSALCDSGEPVWRPGALSSTMLERQSRLDWQVEGYRGPTPFGVNLAWVAAQARGRRTPDSSDTSRFQTVSSVTDSSAPVLSPRTPHVYEGEPIGPVWTHDDGKE